MEALDFFKIGGSRIRRCGEIVRRRRLTCKFCCRELEAVSGRDWTRLIFIGYSTPPGPTQTNDLRSELLQNPDDSIESAIFLYVP